MRERLPHYLRATKGDTQPSQVICVETAMESVCDAHSPTLKRDIPQRIAAVSWRTEAGTMGRVSVIQTADPGEFWRWAIGKLRSGSLTWMFGLSVYRQVTALGLWELLGDGTLVLTQQDPMYIDRDENGRRKGWTGYAVLENPPTIIVVRPPNRPGTLKIVDIANYGIPDWPSIRSACPCGSDWEMTYNKLCPKWDAECGYRAAMLAELVQRLVGTLQANGWGSLQNTAGSQSTYTYKRKFLWPRILVHANESALALEQAAYYGGRCECPYLGQVVPPTDNMPATQVYGADIDTPAETGPLYHYDFNSLYPSVAAVNAMPVRLAHFEPRPGDCITELMSSPFLLIASVIVETDTPAYPVRVVDFHSSIPRDPSAKSSAAQAGYKSEVIWPVGQFVTTLAGPELSDALQRGRVRKVLAFAAYEGEPIFAEFVRELYAKRLEYRSEGNKAGEHWCKRLLNSAFGKFAQRSRRWNDDKESQAAAPYYCWYQWNAAMGKAERFRSLAWHVQREVELGLHPEACPAIAAYVTSLARMRLWNVLAIMPPRSVFYYDTDSIWCTVQGRDKLGSAGLLDDIALGALKLVDVHYNIHFRGIKSYTADGKLVAAGIPLADRFDRDGNPVYDRSVSVNGCLERGKSPQPLVHELTYRARAKYRHGKVNRNGWTAPHHLSDIGSM